MLIGMSAFAATEESDHAIHEELRHLLQGVEQAINAEKYTELAPYFHEKMRVTPINQEVISSRPEIGAYFNKWFGPGVVSIEPVSSYIKKLHISLVPDTLTEFYGNNTFGIIRGSGEENYILADDRHFDMKTRWTATVIKDTDGKWRILSLHIGTNFLDNPILNKAETSLVYFASGGLVTGFILGLLTWFLMGRRKKAAH
jgi:ketosteroid isomerase-like protein